MQDETDLKKVLFVDVGFAAAGAQRVQFGEDVEPFQRLERRLELLERLLELLQRLLELLQRLERLLLERLLLERLLLLETGVADERVGRRRRTGRRTAMAAADKNGADVR